MTRTRFPVERLRAQAGTLSFNTFGGSIELPLAPFTLPQWGEVKTRILLDCLPLEPCSASILQGRTIDIRAIPADQRPEGSVYMGHHHHPADLIVLQFGAASGNQVEAAFNLIFDFEGLGAGEHSEYSNIGWQGKSVLTVLPPSSRH